MNIVARIIRRIQCLQRGRAWNLELRRAARGDIPFADFPEVAASSLLEVRFGHTLLDAKLAALLASEELGSWALDGATLEFLANRLKRDRPAAMLEFGAGVSTLAFAYLMRALHGDAGVFLFSLEQNEWAATKACDQLQKAGLDHVARVFFAPLEEREVEGERCLCYAPDKNARRELEQNAGRIEWILVDGPAGDDWVRFGTLPVARAFAARVGS